MSNILLIRPCPDTRTIGLQHVMICEPLELEYVASNIAGPGRSISILDMILEKKPLSYFIQKNLPDYVLITGYITHVDVIKQYSAIIKKIIPSCMVIVGGVHAEVVPEDFTADTIDCILGTGAIEAVKRLLDKEPMETISGIYRLGTPGVQERSFNLKHPDRSLVSRYRSRYYYMFHNPCALIKTSFGCPYSCRFCFCKEITQGTYYSRDIDDVISELKTIPEQEIYIVDDDFLFDADKLLLFCKKLREQKINKRFLVYGRADFICHHESVIAEFKKVGLRAVIVGLESVREDDLHHYNKRVSLNENEHAIRILQKYDIDLYATLILGMDFSKKDFQILRRWLTTMKITFINLQPLTPLPGTALFSEYEQSLIIPRSDHARWDLAHLVLKPKNLSIRAYYFEIVKLYYAITLSRESVFKLIQRYGIREVLKLSWGSSRVTLQYLQKIIKGS